MSLVNTRKTFIKLLILTLIFSGLVSIALPFFNSLKNEAIASLINKEIEEASIQKEEKKIIIPKRLKLPKVKVDVEVREATVSANNWGLYDDAVSYLKTSGKLGETGNAVFYAHNTQFLFGPLRYSEIGDRIFIETNERTLSYVISDKKVVGPEKIDIVYSSNDERLTLFTCANFMDADRLVIVAKPTLVFGDMISDSIN